jgi:hypothetical protein
MTVCQDIGLDHRFFANDAFDRESARVDFGCHALDDDPVSTFFRLHCVPPAKTLGAVFAQL